jgi:hypothetical protein
LLDDVRFDSASFAPRRDRGVGAALPRKKQLGLERVLGAFERFDPRMDGLERNTTDRALTTAIAGDTAATGSDTGR